MLKQGRNNKTGYPKTFSQNISEGNMDQVCKRTSKGKTYIKHDKPIMIIWYRSCDMIKEHDMTYNTNWFKNMKLLLLKQGWIRPYK